MAIQSIHHAAQLIRYFNYRLIQVNQTSGSIKPLAFAYPMVVDIEKPESIGINGMVDTHPGRAG